MIDKNYLKFVSDTARIIGYAIGLLEGVAMQVADEPLINALDDAIKDLKQKTDALLDLPFIAELGAELESHVGL